MAHVPLAAALTEPAVSLPQVIAPAIAAPLVALTGGYVTLYVVAAIVCFVGSALVGRITSVD